MGMGVDAGGGDARGVTGHLVLTCVARGADMIAPMSVQYSTVQYSD